MKVTIKDIAKETGLSTATVSKYLNNIKIQENNRILIEAAIEKLGYRPNRSAQILRSKKTRTIGILISDLGNYFWGSVIGTISHYFAREKLGYRPNRSAQILRSKKTRTIGILISDLGNYFWGSVIGTISHYFASQQYTVITRSYSFDMELEKNVIRDIISQNFEGLIMLPFNNCDHYYKLLQNAGIPVIILDQLPTMIQEYPVDCVLSDNYDGSALLAEHLYQNGHTNICILDQAVLPTMIQEYPVDCVLSDNYDGSALLAEHLYQNGHTNICILDQAVNSHTIEVRIKAVKDVYSRHGINLTTCFPCPEPFIFKETKDVILENKQRLCQILDSPDPPTAVFFTNYISAMGGLSAVNSLGLNVPDDISLVCFDNDPLFRAMHTSMTCVAQDLTSIGIRASELLMQRISGDYSDFPVTEIINVEFHSGKSVRNLHTGR